MTGEGFLDGGYGAVSSVLSIIGITLMLVVARLTTRYPLTSHGVRQLVSIMLAAGLGLLLGAIRTWVGAAADGGTDLDSAFRIALTICRVYVAVASWLLIWEHTR